MRQNDELCTPADPSSTRASHPKDKHRGCFRVRGQSDLREHLGHHVPVNTLCTRRQAVFGGTDREGLGKYRFDWISWRSSLRAGPADLHSLLRPLRYAPSPTRACRRGHGQAPQTSSVSPTVCICGTSPSISRRFHTAFPATSGGDGIYYINRTDSHCLRVQADGGACRPSRGRWLCLPSHVEGDIGRQRHHRPHHQREGPRLLLTGRTGPAQTRE